MSDAEPLVRRELRPSGVLLLTWNRPERANAWTLDLERVYFALLEQAAVDPDVRAIVVTGAGRHFCPGMDRAIIDDVAAGGFDTRPEDRQPGTLPASIPKPIVAAINGACAGIGLMQALVCDVRFVAKEANLSTAWVRRGMVAEHGMAFLLSRIAGEGVAMDLLLSGRVFSGDEAAALRLASAAVPRDEVVATALAYASDLATTCSPAAMASIKAQVHAAATESLEDSRVRWVRLWRDQHRDHPDFVEGAAAFRDDRPPAYLPLGDGSDAT